MVFIAQTYAPVTAGAYEFHLAFNAWGGPEPWLCRDVLASARIPKFLWAAGDELSIDPWLLHDSPRAWPNSTLLVPLLIGEMRFHLAEWRTGAVAANENKHDETIHFSVPKCDADRMLVRIDCLEDATLGSQYLLRYRSTGLEEEAQQNA